MTGSTRSIGPRWKHLSGRNHERPRGFRSCRPLFNKRLWIRRALDSIAAQTLAAIEVIVVDDGSTDGSDRIAAHYPDARFRLIQQENAGPGAARNRGLQECSAEFVAFLDGDDEWLPDYLETSVREIERLGPEVATISCSFLNGAGDSSSVDMWSARGISDGPCRTQADTDPVALAHRLAFMHCCCTLARLKAVRRWGGFYEKDKCLYAEDSFLWLKILLNETIACNLSPPRSYPSRSRGLSQNLTGARPDRTFPRTTRTDQNRRYSRRICSRFCGDSCRFGLSRLRVCSRILGPVAKGRGGYVGAFCKPGDAGLTFIAGDRVCSRTPLGPAVAAAWRALAPGRPIRRNGDAKRR